MKGKFRRPRKKPRVQRITVDEQVSDDLIRLVICPLAEGANRFYYQKLELWEDWGEEDEVWVTPDTYIKEMGISSEDLAWKDLQEGQVYISGEFEIVGERREPEYLRFSPRQRELLRIDRLAAFKEVVKKTYFELLRRR